MLPKYLKPFHVNKSNLIRIGPKTDGGYIVDKRILGKNNILVTCGLNDDWEFEKEFVKKNKDAPVIAFDHTVNKNFWIKRFKKDFISLLFLKKLKINKILDVFKYIDYYLFFRKNKIHYKKKIVSKSKNKNQISIPEILKPLNNVVLKVDIEGDEYKILNDVIKNENKIICLIIEFHEVSKKLNEILKFKNELKNLKLIHIHANNYAGIDENGDPNCIELTFLNSNKFSVDEKKSNLHYPVIGLDSSNMKRRKDLSLKFKNE